MFIRCEVEDEVVRLDRGADRGGDETRASLKKKKRRKKRTRKKTRRSPPVTITRPRVLDTRTTRIPGGTRGATRLSWTKERPIGETRRGRHGRFGAGGSARRGRRGVPVSFGTSWRVISSNLPVWFRGAVRRGYGSEMAERQRPLGLGWSRSETIGVRHDRRARARRKRLQRARSDVRPRVRDV